MSANRPEILPDLTEQIKAAQTSKIRAASKPMSNWASRMGHPCTRYLVHSRLDWKHVPPIPVERKMLFDLGNVFEQQVAKKYLEDANYQIVEMGRNIHDEKSGLLERVKIHGKIDFIVRDPNGWEFPVEVKSMNPHTWDKINTIEDMTTAKQFYVRQYPTQLLLYLLGKEYEVGAFLLVNKVTGAVKHLWVHQDYTDAENLIQRAESVNRHVEAGTYPERIAYDENVCGKCEFATICLENVPRTELEVLSDPEIEDQLREREELKPMAKRYDEVSDIVKRKLSGVKKATTGDFYIEGKESTRMVCGGDCTKKESKSWRTSIRFLGKEAPNDPQG